MKPDDFNTLLLRYGMMNRAWRESVIANIAQTVGMAQVRAALFGIVAGVGFAAFIFMAAA